MAVDEALLDACARGEPGFPCLRFYRWDPPAISLGHHQDAYRAVDLEALSAHGIDLVRRVTGGRAVLHSSELTYSVVGHGRNGTLAGPVMDVYRRISEAIAIGLQRLGLPARLSAGERPPARTSPEPCFARLGRGEIEVAGRKVAGSVQLQRGGCLLQHGSLPLRLDPERLSLLTGGTMRVPAWGIEDALGRPLLVGELEGALVAGFASRFQVALVEGRLTAWEESRAGELDRNRYGVAAWNRRVPARREPLGGRGGAS
jgi:lipoate-protein ligase A